MRYARIDTDGRAVEFIEVEDEAALAERYHPSLIFAAAPPEVAIGWRIQDGEWLGPEIPDPAELLIAAQAQARVAIIARANAFTAPILSRYPDAERAGWFKREAEARAIIVAQDKAAAIAATSVIKALAQAAGETTAATVARAELIVARADEFAAISAAVEIMRDIALTAIDAVEDAADMPATLEALKVQATALAAEHGLA